MSWQLFCLCILHTDSEVGAVYVLIWQALVQYSAGQKFAH